MRPGPHVHVQTRGAARAADYAFLGGAPARAWWRDYRDATAFDHPTVLVTGDGACWAAYLSGIPSARTDAVGTVVRYTLVLDGPCGDTAVAPRLVAAVAAWLDDLAADGRPGADGRRGSAAAPDGRFAVPDGRPAAAQDRPLAASPDGRSAADHDGRPAAAQNGRPAAGPDGRPAAGPDGRPAAGPDGRPAAVWRGRLAAALDARFPTADVQRLLDDPPPPPLPPLCGGTSWTEPAQRVLDALAVLPAPQPGADVPGSWIGGVGTPAARSAFVARVAALVDGRPGRALLLNLVGGPDDLAAVPGGPPGAGGPDPAAPLAVLVESGDGALGRPVALRSERLPSGAPRSGVEAKKAPTPPAGSRRTPAAAVSDGARLLAVAGLVLVALAMTLLLLL